MKKEFNETQSSFIYKLEGTNELDAINLSKSIDILAQTFSLVTEGYNRDSYLKMRVSAISPGSFVIDFNLLIGAATTLLTGIGVNNAQEIISIFVEIVKTKLFLNGKEPAAITSNGDVFNLENSNGATITIDKRVFNIYSEQPKIDENIAAITKLAQLEDRSGITIESTTDMISFSSDQFTNMSKVVIKEALPETCLKNTVEVELLLRSPDLIGHSKWGFYFTKNICATIEDEEFIKNVLNRKITALYSGVKIPVIMEIITPLDKHGVPIENKEKYTILKVTGDIIEPIDENSKQISYL